MISHPPSILWLTAFEAVARHQSVTRAAAELCVTQSAVSIRLRSLEDHLGFRLFHREPFRLTQAGRRYLVTARDVLERLLRGEASAGASVRLSAFATFAELWLIPRFARLIQDCAEPEIDLVVSQDGERECDADLRIGTANPDILSAARLIDDEIIAVCHPDLAARHQLRSLADLSNVRLLCENRHGVSAAAHDDAARWLKSTGLDVRAKMRPWFWEGPAMVQAALHRVGVALVRHSLVLEQLEEGRLVRPIGDAIPCGEPVYLTWTKPIRRGSAIARVRDWLLREGAVTRVKMAAGRVGDGITTKSAT
jgi:LysR family transcriptional regulator, glycine cleavage system transcriptional activator